MRVGICTGPDQGAVLAAAGADFMEVTVAGLLVPDRPDDEFNTVLATADASPVPVEAANCFLPGTLKCAGPDTDAPALLKWAETTFARARLAGIDVVVFGSGGSRTAPDGFDPHRAFEQYVDTLGMFAPAAKQHHVTIVVEPLAERYCNVVTSVEAGAEAVARCSHPNVRLLADVHHMDCNGEDPSILEQHGHLIDHVHIAEGEQRTAPGVNGFDFGPYLKALHAGGYDGRFSMECAWDDLDAQAGDAVASFREQLAASGF